MSKSLYILLQILNFCVCFSQEPNFTNSYQEDSWVPRVVNGYPAVLGDVPYQVAFKFRRSRYTQSYVTFCGGVIIQPEKLLTAAHCFENKGLDCMNLFSKGPIQARKRSLMNKYAVAGNLLNRGYYSRDGPNGQWRKLNKVVYPRGYRFPHLDIAVAVLRNPFIYNQYINEIPVAIEPKDYVGKCLVSGYGRTSPRGTSERLLLAQLELVPAYKCNILHRRDMRRFICTSTKFTDVGQGDSGGPLVCSNTGDPRETSKGVLVGIVSGNNRLAGSFFTRSSLVNIALTSSSIGEVRLGELPHHVMIFRLYDHKQFLYRAYCAGSIIAESRVLTSAKCFLTNRKRKRHDYNQLRIAAGILHTFSQEPLQDGTQQWRSVKKVYSQRFYRFPAYSLAIVETNTPWIFNQFVKKIPYASIDQDFDGVCVSTNVKSTKSWSTNKNVFFEELKLITRRTCERTLLRSCRLYICTYVNSETYAASETEGNGVICHGTGDPKETDEMQGILVGVTVVINANMPSLHSRVGLFHQWVTDDCCQSKLDTYTLLLCSHIYLILMVFTK